MNDLHNPGTFFTVTDEDIRGEYGNQRDDDDCLFCAILSGMSVLVGLVVIGIMISAALKTDALRHQEAFSGYRTASTEQGR